MNKSLYTKVDFFVNYASCIFIILVDYFFSRVFMKTKTVCLRKYDNPIDAQIALGRLESEGIFGFLANQNDINLYPSLTLGGEGIQLRIREEDAIRAQQILGIEDK